MDKFNSTTVFNRLRLLADKHPFVSLFSIGSSHMGQPICCAKIGNGERRLFFSAAHHANEWITALLLLRFLEEYCATLERNGSLIGRKVKALFEKTTLFAVPLVNPDGADLVGGTLTKGKFFEEAKRIADSFPDIPFPRGWKANVRGTDLNLQYPADWEAVRARKASLGFSRPAPKNFTGLAPLTEPEAGALFRFTAEYQPDAVIALHTQGGVIYDTFKGYAPKESYPLTERMTAESGYPTETTPADSDGAGYKDWFIQAFGRVGLTVECGHGESPLPLSQLDEIYRALLPILLIALEG